MHCPVLVCSIPVIVTEIKTTQQLFVFVTQIRDCPPIKTGGRTTPAPLKKTRTRTAARLSSPVSVHSGRRPITSLPAPRVLIHLDLSRPFTSPDDYNRVFIKLEEVHSNDGSHNYEENDDDDSSDEEDDGPTKYINASHVSVCLFISHLRFSVSLLDWL